MLLGHISSHPGQHDWHVINACCSSCSTGEQRCQSRRLHLQTDRRFLRHLRHGAHHDGNAATDEAIRAVWGEYCDPKGVHTNRRNCTPEEATVTEIGRQHAQISYITAEKAIVTETGRFCALAQVMPNYYENNFFEEEDHPLGKQRRRRELEHPHQTKKRHDHRNLRIVIKGWSTAAKSWGVLDRNYTTYYARGLTFFYCWGRSGCTASRDRQY